RAQRSTSRAFTPVFAGFGGALQTPISGLPEIGDELCASRVNPTCVDRFSLWRSQFPGASRSGGRLSRPRTVFFSFFADSESSIPGLTISSSHTSSFPRRVFCARGLHPCFTRPE